MSFKDVYEECLIMEGGNKYKAVESALSLFTMGLFDASEGDARHELIVKTLHTIDK